MRTVTTMACASLIVAVSNVRAAETSRLRVHIDPQPMHLALQDLGQQTRLSIVFSADRAALNRWQAPLVSGEFSAAEALERMLSNTTLTFKFVNANTVWISDAAKTNDDTAAVNPATPQGAGQPLQSPEASTGMIVEEVVVTARKRAERLQDVPISITAITAGEIDRRGLVGAADYLRGVPGANQIEGAPSQSITIRGIETNTVYQGFRGGETTGTYFGETPMVGVAGMLGSSVDIKVVDVERVEVLRGPQGTAFGSASMGGTVRIIPVAPKLDRLEGKFATEYSSTSGGGADNYMFQGVANLPLVSGKVAVRGAAYVFSDGGYYRNRAGTDPNFQALATTYGAEAFATDEDEVGAYNVSGGRLSVLFRATDDLRFTASYLNQKNETDGIPVATSGRFEQTIFRVAPEHVRRGQAGGLLDYSIESANAVVEYDLQWADLLATYSHVNGESIYVRPYTSVGVNWALSQLNASPHEGRIGELRLASKFPGRWNFLAGLYGENSEDEYSSQGIWFGDPSRSLFPGQGRQLADFLERRHLRQRAAFGEASWEILSGLTFTGGMRAYEYDRDSRVDQSGYLNGGSSVTTVGHVTDSGTTFRANLSYKPADDALLYASYSQGFRVGGPQPGLQPGVCDLDGDGVVDGTGVTIESTRKIDPDGLNNYEIGGKIAALDRRLTIDASVFRMEWSGMPVARILQNPSIPACLAGFSANAGTALSEGVELQAKFQATDSLRFDLGASYIDARLTKDVPAQKFRAGNKLPGAPQKNANAGVQYDFAVLTHDAFARADAIYVGPFFGDLLQSPVTKSGDYVKLDLTVRVSIDALNLDFFVRNLTNEDAFTFRGAYNFAGLDPEFYGYRLRPRTVGLRLGYDF